MTGNSRETATEMTQFAILKPGDNCWRIEQADRVSLLVGRDGGTGQSSANSADPGTPIPGLSCRSMSLTR